MTFRVLIVDDAPSVRQELRTVLSLTGEIEIAGEAENGRQAVVRTCRLGPDVVLMDLEMPVMDGCEASRRIKAVRPDCRIVALTIHDDHRHRQMAAEAGMDAFVVKGSSLETMLDAISGETSFSPGGHS